MKKNHLKKMILMGVAGATISCVSTVQADDANTPSSAIRKPRNLTEMDSSSSDYSTNPNYSTNPSSSRETSHPSHSSTQSSSFRSSHPFDGKLSENRSKPQHKGPHWALSDDNDDVLDDDDNDNQYDNNGYASSQNKAGSTSYYNRAGNASYPSASDSWGNSQGHSGQNIPPRNYGGNTYGAQNNASINNMDNMYNRDDSMIREDMPVNTAARRFNPRMPTQGYYGTTNPQGNDGVYYEDVSGPQPRRPIIRAVPQRGMPPQRILHAAPRGPMGHSHSCAACGNK